MVNDMEKLEFTFLTKEQVEELSILENYGIGAAMTDFSILLGGLAEDEGYRYYTSEGNLLKDRTGWWWTKTSVYDYVYVVCNDGNSDDYDAGARQVGARPALSYSSISEISMNVVSGEKEILEVEYGEYPQDIVSEEFSKKLEDLYTTNKLNKTGKSYTTDSVKWNSFDVLFQERKHIEYEYDGEKYIRFVADSNSWGAVLSDGRKVEEGKPYWLKVEPIKWMIDKKTNIALSKKIIFAGVQFNNEEYYTVDFENTIIYRFLNEIFAKEIIPSNTVDKETIEQLKAIVQAFEQLLQQLSDIQEEQQKLLAKEAELKAQLEQMQAQIEGKGQYVKQQY